MENKIVSVKDFGAVGDGINDDRAGIQAALDSGASEVVIPFGTYAVSKTLYVSSNTKITASKCARIVLTPNERCKRGDFLISNKNTTGLDENISIFGGIWDGNNTSPFTAKPDIFDKTGYSGTVMNFVGVNGLSLKNLVVANSTTYNIRLSRVENFTIENIDFVSDEFGWNQDGLHFGGGVRHGCVKCIRALSKGQTNDDMIALNADDSIERVENLDIVRDDIEDITFEDIFAENCYTIVRMLSVNVNIRNIKFKNIYAGYRNYAINGDGARYCKTPLFKEDEYPRGVGNIENIEFENFVCWPVTEPLKRLPNGQVDSTYGIRLESNCDNFKIKGFKKLPAENDADTYAFLMTLVCDTEVMADGISHKIAGKDDRVLLSEFSELEIRRNK